MHHSQINMFYHILYSFFPICKRKEFKLFQLLENFKKKEVHRPVAKDRPWSTHEFYSHKRLDRQFQINVPNHGLTN
jgi:hypothetical protein